MTIILSGTDLATSLRAGVTARAASLIERSIQPKLAVVTATDDASTAWYVRSIAKQAQRTGIVCEIVNLGPTADNSRIHTALASLSDDHSVHGIILQTPLPDYGALPDLRAEISPAKDVDGANPVSLGRLLSHQRAFAPATAQAVISLLDHYGIELRGRTAAVVGRSIVVGTPLANMLVQRDATVTLCHRHTRNLSAITRAAEIVVVAVGVPGLISAEHLVDGAIVIDVGTTADDDGRLLGDVDAHSVEGRAGALSPVPGGVGPVTTTLLLANTITAATDLATGAPDDRRHCLISSQPT